MLANPLCCRLAEGKRMRFDGLRRREFMTLLGGVATWPLEARAQQPAMPVIGFLSPQLAGPAMDSRLGGFQNGLSELDYADGRNVRIEYRWAEGRYERLRLLADGIVREGVSLIVAPTHDAALAAKAVTNTIPIAFISGGDPVLSGLVASMNRPGGNMTGINMFSYELNAKRLGLLHEMVPKVAVVGVLINPRNASAENQWRELQRAAKSLGLDAVAGRVNGDDDLEQAVQGLVTAGAQAITAEADPFLAGSRERLVALSQKNNLPAIWEWPDFVTEGGLMSYGTSIVDAYRQLGVYAGRILKGEKPAELPVLQPVKFELAINLKTAKALGIEIPATLLVSADEVIE
jgi:putative tryptophan/tyrosine transport system substrate-binding protein